MHGDKTRLSITMKIVIWTELQSYSTAFGFNSCPIEDGYACCIAGWKGTGNINSTNHANLSSV